MLRQIAGHDATRVRVGEATSEDKSAVTCDKEQRNQQELECDVPALPRPHAFIETCRRLPFVDFATGHLAL